MLSAPTAEQVWVASIDGGLLVSIAATIVEQGAGTVTLALRGHGTFARGAEAVLTFPHRADDQRLGRIVAADAHTVRVAIAERTVQI